jgi:hypothetical protein
VGVQPIDLGDELQKEYFLPLLREYWNMIVHRDKERYLVLPYLGVTLEPQPNLQLPWQHLDNEPSASLIVLIAISTIVILPHKRDLLEI